MASSHSRSNSFPSQSHPVMNDVEDHLERLKASTQAGSTSSICTKLTSLRDLHDVINNLIQMPSIQQSLSYKQGGNSINELLEGSLRLVDLSGFSRDIVQLTKESVQELESSIRRQAYDVNAYVASRKKINKMVNKYIKNNLIKTDTNRNSTLPHVGAMLKEAESHNLSVLKSVLMLLSGEKEQSYRKRWSMLSKFTEIHFEVEQESAAEDLCSLLDIHKSRKSMESKNMLKQLKSSETTIEEIEQGLEAVFKSLVKTRVYLLNVLSH